MQDLTKRLLALQLVLLLTNAVAQSSSTDSLFIPRKTHYKYIGIQANLLLQQFISFNSNSSINTNPYIFSYSKNNLSTGKGFVFGTGFSISERSNNDGVASSTIQDINATFRVGSDRKYYKYDKFIPITGIETSFGTIYNKTRTRLNQSITNTETVIETTKFFAGPSFRGGLLYALSKHVLIGSEFFFNVQIAFSSTNTNINPGVVQSFAPINVGFQAPTALFLVFKY